MTITKRPEVPPKGAEEFISGAPDAGAAPKRKRGKAGEPRKIVTQGEKEQISVTFPPGRVDVIMRAAKKRDMTRAAYINEAVRLLLIAEGEL